VSTAAKVQIPRLATKMTIDPRGRFLVFTGNDYSLDSHGQPNVYDYALVTVPLDAKGGLGQAWPESQKIAGLLFDDLAVSPSGHLVTARTLYTGTVDAGDENPLEVYAQPAPGQWKVCQALRLAGSGHVAIAPP
jgi:hypothetical protein